jgi:hypothetical protein
MTAEQVREVLDRMLRAQRELEDLAMDRYDEAEVLGERRRPAPDETARFKSLHREARRLAAKAQGVALARGYLEEALRG